MEMYLVAIVALFIGIVAGEQKCHKDSHGVRRYNGKPCASTTRYNDGHRGACGCGPSASDTPFNWNMASFVTAPNQAFFDDGGNSQWCGKRCGRCVKLTPTGGFVQGQGTRPTNMQSRVFMITNDCPKVGNFEWCGQGGKPGTNKVNNHGYEVHFDLQNNRAQVKNIGWDNPEVTYEEVSCPSDFKNKWGQCECH